MAPKHRKEDEGAGSQAGRRERRAAERAKRAKGPPPTIPVPRLCLVNQF